MPAWWLKSWYFFTWRLGWVTVLPCMSQCNNLLSEWAFIPLHYCKISISFELYTSSCYTASAWRLDSSFKKYSTPLCLSEPYHYPVVVSGEPLVSYLQTWNHAIIPPAVSRRTDLAIASRYIRFFLPASLQLYVPFLPSWLFPMQLYKLPYLT